MQHIQAIHRLKKLAKTVAPSEKEALDFAISELSDLVGGYYIIDSDWNIEKMERGKAGNSRYDEMQEWLLNDMKQLFGYCNAWIYDNQNKGQERYCFSIDGVQFVYFISANFDAHTGEFVGISVFKRGHKSFAGIPKEERPALIKTEVNNLLMAFEKKATELGYLI